MIPGISAVRESVREDSADVGAGHARDRALKKPLQLQLNIIIPLEEMQRIGKGRRPEGSRLYFELPTLAEAGAEFKVKKPPSPIEIGDHPS